MNLPLTKQTIYTATGNDVCVIFVRNFTASEIQCQVWRNDVIIYDTIRSEMAYGVMTIDVVDGDVISAKAYGELQYKLM